MKMFFEWFSERLHNAISEVVSVVTNHLVVLPLRGAPPWPYHCYHRNKYYENGFPYRRSKQN